MRVIKQNDIVIVVKGDNIELLGRMCIVTDSDSVAVGVNFFKEFESTHNIFGTLKSSTGYYIRKEYVKVIKECDATL